MENKQSITVDTIWNNILTHKCNINNGFKTFHGNSDFYMQLIEKPFYIGVASLV